MRPDCERLVTAAEHDLDAERLRADGLAAELAVSKRLYAVKCDQHMEEHTARLRAEAENERLKVEILGLLRSFVGVVVNITATANEVNETIKAKLAHYEVQP
jgi:hypothetical protein